MANSVDSNVDSTRPLSLSFCICSKWPPTLLVLLGVWLGLGLGFATNSLVYGYGQGQGQGQGVRRKHVLRINVAMKAVVLHPAVTPQRNCNIQSSSCRYLTTKAPSSASRAASVGHGTHGAMPNPTMHKVPVGRGDEGMVYVAAARYGLGSLCQSPCAGGSVIMTGRVCLLLIRHRLGCL